VAITAGCFIDGFPALDYLANGGAAGSPTDLDLNVDFTNLNTSNVLVTYQFFATGTTTVTPVAIDGVTVKDIDYSNNNWQDVITVLGVNSAGTTVNPDFISQFNVTNPTTPTWTPNPPTNGVTNTITAQSASGSIPSTDQHGWASFNFSSQKVRSFTVKYGPGNGGGANDPSQQKIYISSLGFSNTVTVTQAVVADVTAYVDGGQSWLEWQTRSEVGTVGFNVYRLDPATDKFERINERVLPALFGSPRGGVYRFADPGAVAGRTYTYGLEELEAGGTSRVHGPYTVTVGAPTTALRKAQAASASTATPGAKAQAMGNPARFERRAHAASGRVAQTAAAGPTLKAAAVSAASANTTMRILVEQDGLYVLTAAEIAATLGVDVQQIKTAIGKSKLRLQQRGTQVQWTPGPAGDRLYFYGQAIDGVDSIYTRYNVYWLDQADGQTMKIVGGKAPAAKPSTLPYVAHVHAEQNNAPAFFLRTDPDADFWFWNYVVAGDPSEGAPQFAVVAPAPATTGTATLTARLQGATDDAVGNDHHARIFVNGTEVGNAAWDGLTARNVTASFPASLLAADGNNIVTVRGDLDPGVAYSVFWVDAFDLDYPRGYRTSDDRLALRAAGNAIVTVNGFTSGNVAVLDVSDPRKPQWLSALTLAASGGTTAVSFTPAKPTTDYFAAIARAPVAVQGDAPGTLKAKGNGAAYLALTPAVLRAGADALALYRGGKVVELQDIYDEFNFGIANPHAVQDFLAYANQNWKPKPRFVALVGKGTFDPKDYLGLGTNLFPVLMTSTPHGLFPADNRYADFDDNGVPNVAIGRIPALTVGDVTRYVGKLGVYEGSPIPANQALLAADNPDDAGDFTADSQRVGQSLTAAGYTTTRVYLANATPAQARQQIIDTLNGGVGLFNYAGHGGADVLADEAIFSSADVASLVNGARLPILLAFTCVVGNGSYPGYDSLAEAMLWRDGGGAVAAFAPSALSEDAFANKLNLALVKSLVGPGASPSLGEAANAALTSLAQQGGPRYMIDIYSVIGDPALRAHR
jgi:hypothetical protein